MGHVGNQARRKGRLEHEWGYHFTIHHWHGNLLWQHDVGPAKKIWANCASQLGLLISNWETIKKHMSKQHPHDSTLEHGVMTRKESAMMQTCTNKFRKAPILPKTLPVNSGDKNAGGHKSLQVYCSEIQQQLGGWIPLLFKVCFIQPLHSTGHRARWPKGDPAISAAAKNISQPLQVVHMKHHSSLWINMLNPKNMATIGNSTSLTAGCSFVESQSIEPNKIQQCPWKTANGVPKSESVICWFSFFFPMMVFSPPDILLAMIQSQTSCNRDTSGSAQRFQTWC